MLSNQGLFVANREVGVNDGLTSIKNRETYGKIFIALKYFLILAGSLSNFVARCLIFNIIILFGARDKLREAFDKSLEFQLSIIEIIMLGHVFTFRSLCKITGTRTKNSNIPNSRYDIRGILRYNEIHEQYWNYKQITYKDEESSYSIFANVFPITKFLDIPEIELPNQDSKNIISNKFYEEKREVELSTAENDAHKGYFSFHKRSRKKVDSQSL